MRLYLVIACIFVLYHVSSSALKSKVFVLNSPTVAGEKKMVVLWAEGTDGEESTIGCELFSDKRLIDEVLKTLENDVILWPTKEEMAKMLEDCTTFSLRRRRRRALKFRNQGSSSDKERSASRQKSSTTPPDVTTEGEGYSGWNVIFPGTKWCGAGDIAKNYEDLGFHQDTDRCCRAHDNCDDMMAPGETKNNLTNTSPFTKLSCKCDNDFYDCLNRVDSVTSNTIGNTYFNLLSRSCYAEGYPMTDNCNKYKTFLKLSCSEYEQDKNATKVYQWNSARKYKKIPIPGPLTVSIPFL